MFGFDAANTGRNEGTAGPADDVTRRWDARTGGSVSSSPAIVDGVVYVGSDDGSLYAFDATTGDRQWSYETAGPVSSSPAVVDGVVYIGSEAGGVHAVYAANGTRKWVSQSERAVARSSPTVVGGTVYVGFTSGLVTALNAATGDRQWQFSADGAVVSAPAVAGDQVYVSSYDRRLYALNRASGAVEWSVTTSRQLYSSPAVADGTVYVGSFDGQVYAVDAGTGDTRWRYDTGAAVYSSPAVTDDTVYIGTLNNSLLALETDGSVRWRFSTDAGIISSPAVTDGTVYVGSYDDRVYAVDAARGSERWNETTDADVTASPAVSDGAVYVGTAQGSVYALAGGTGDGGDAPDAAFSVSPTTVEAGSPLSFDASESTGSVRTYRWSFGDGASTSGASPATFYTYDNPGTYTVELTVVGPDGGSDTATRTVTVTEATVGGPEIVSVTPDIGGTKLQGISFSNTYTATVDSEAPIEEVRFSLAGSTTTDRDGSDGWQADLDMGVLDGDAVLTVTAVDAQGRTDRTVSRVSVVGIPDWLELVAERGGVTIDEENGTFELARTVPDPPIDASMDVPGAIPLVGGEQSFEANARFGVVYDAPEERATILGEGTLAVTVIQRDAEGTLGAEGTVDTEEWELRRAKLWVEVSVEAWSTAYAVNVPGFSPEFDVGVSPQVGFATYLKNRNGGLRVTRGEIDPGIGAEGELEIETRGAELSGLLSGDLTASLSVPAPYQPGGTATLSGSVTVEAFGYSRLFDVLSVERGFGSKAGGDGSVQTIPASAVSGSAWRLPEKYGSVPGVNRTTEAGTPASTVDSGGSTDTSSVAVATAAAGQRDARLTQNRVADRSPAVTYDETTGTYTVVWSQQSPSKSTAAGRDLVVAHTDGDGGWTSPVSITDDTMTDLNPSLATSSATGTTVVVWTRVDGDLAELSADGSNPAYNRTEIVYAVHDGSSWSAPQQLTDNKVPDVTPQVAYSERADRWQFVWERDADGNISTVTDASVVLADSADNGGELTPVTRATVPSAARPVVADGPGETPFSLAYVDPVDRINGSVVYATLDDAGSVTVRSRDTTRRLKDVGVAGDSLVWVDGPASDPTVHYTPRAGSVSPEQLRIPNVSDVRDVTLRSVDDGELLTYRGRPTGRSKKAVFYKTTRDGRWTDGRQLTARSDLSYWQAATASGDGAFVSAFVGKNFTAAQSQKHDIFVVSHELRPDLSVNATLHRDADGSPTVGDTASAIITVSNDGDTAVTAPITVSLATGAGTPVGRTTIDGLAAGAQTTRTLSGTVDETGALVVTATPTDSVDELSTANNRARLQVVSPDLTVASVSATRTGDTAAVNATVVNTGSVAATDVAVRVATEGSDTSLARATIGTVAADSRRQVTLDTTARAVSADAVTVVSAATNGSIASAAGSADRWVGRLLRPDLQVSAATTDFYRRSGGGVAVETVVVNRGQSPATATVTVGNETTQLGQRRLDIPAATTPGGSSYLRTTVPVRDLVVGESVSVTAAGRYDRRTANDVAVLTVETVQSPSDLAVVAADGTAEFTSIGAALDAVSAGGTVVVRPGTYAEAVTLDANVTLVAPAGATLDGTALDETPTGLTIPVGSPARPLVEGFTITGYATGIDASNSTGAWTVANVTLTDNDRGVIATDTTGAWQLTESGLTDNAVVGVDATGASTRGDATRNWWGAPSGPSGSFGGAGDAAVGELVVRPFYTDADLTAASSGGPNAENRALLSFDDVTAARGATTVTVDRAQYERVRDGDIESGPYRVVIHERTAAGLSAPVGVSDRLTPGMHRNVTVDLGRTLGPGDTVGAITEEAVLVAMLYHADVENATVGAPITRRGTSVTDAAVVSIPTDDSLNLSVASRTSRLGPNDTFTATVRVDSNGNPVTGADATLAYDPSVLTVTAVERGPYLSRGAPVTASEMVDRTAGLVRIEAEREASDGAGVDGTGVLLRVRFRVADADRLARTGTTSLSVPSAIARGTDGEVLGIRTTNATLQTRPVAVAVTPSRLSRLTPGDRFSINVTAASRGWQLSDGELRLQYDPTVLDVVDVRPGDVLSSDAVNTQVDTTVDDDSGTIHYDESRPDDNAVAGSGTLVTVDFKVNDSAGAGTDVTLDLAAASFRNGDGVPRPVALTDGSVTVTGNRQPIVDVGLLSTVNNAGVPVVLAVNASDPDGTVSEVRVQSPTSTTVRTCAATSCQLRLSQTPTASSWDGTGYERVAYTVIVVDDDGTASRSVVRTRIHIPGDATGDGRVDIFDALTVARAWQTTRGSPGYSDAADMNNDGRVDIFDAVVIGRNWQATAD